MPSPKAAQEFKELIIRRYGVLLSDADAMEQAGNLLRLYRAVYDGPQGKSPTGHDGETGILPEAPVTGR